MDLERGRALAVRRKRYQDRRRESDPLAFAANRKRQHHDQRERMIAFLGGACEGCHHADRRALVIVQAAGSRLRWDQLYALMLAEPAELRAFASIMCANCRLVQRHHGG